MRCFDALRVPLIDECELPPAQAHDLEVHEDKVDLTGSGDYADRIKTVDNVIRLARQVCRYCLIMYVGAIYEDHRPHSTLSDFEIPCRIFREWPFPK